MKRYGDLEKAELERRVAVAQSEAVHAEHYGWVLAVAVAVLGGFAVTWLLSVPVAIVGYFLLNGPKKKALAAAEAELHAYESQNPASTFL